MQQGNQLLLSFSGSAPIIYRNQHIVFHVIYFILFISSLKRKKKIIFYAKTLFPELDVEIPMTNNEEVTDIVKKGGSEMGILKVLH